MSATGCGGQTQESNPKTSGLGAFDPETQRLLAKLKRKKEKSNWRSTDHVRDDPARGDACVAAAEADRVKRNRVSTRRQHFIAVYGITLCQYNAALHRLRRRLKRQRAQTCNADVR